MSFAWTTHPSGLLSREDEAYWHGTHATDPGFVLIRKKGSTRDVQCFEFGGLDEATVERLLAEFLTMTGGVPSGSLVLRGVLKQGLGHQHLGVAFDLVVKVVRSALALISLFATDTHLDPDGRDWKVVFTVHHCDDGASREAGRPLRLN